MPALLCTQKTAFIKKTSLLRNVLHSRNCHSRLVKIQQRIHKEMFHNSKKKKMWHIKKMRLFFTTKRKKLLRCGKNDWHAVAFIFWATFKRAKNRPKSDPRLFFLNLFLNVQAFIISGKKPNFLYARSSRYNCPTFYEKKISHYNRENLSQDEILQIHTFGQIKLFPWTLPKSYLLNLCRNNSG